MTHELKILPKWYADVESGKKNFEIRRSDRDFKVGDTLVLREHERGNYTGRQITRKIQYIYQGDGTYGLSEDFCLLGLEQEPCVVTMKDLSKDEINHFAEEMKKMKVQVIPFKESCEDAISRDMALEKMADYVSSGYANSAEDFEEYSKIICQLPPVSLAVPCEDAISRQAVLDKAITIPIAKIVTEDKVICRKVIFVDDIEHLPSVSPTRPKGKWEEYLKEGLKYKCSACGSRYDTPWFYCPNCGVDMRGNINEND